MKTGIAAVIGNDSLAQAEKLTGKSYKEDGETMRLGMAKHILNTERAERVLKENNDTTFSCTLSTYLKVVKDIGFKELLVEPFEKDNCKRHMYVMWHDDGILLQFDTFNWEHRPEESINSSSLYLNFKNTTDICFYNDAGFSFSCSYKDGIEIINCDGREAIRHKVSMFKNNGEIIKPWVDSMMFSITHHGENRGDEDYGEWSKRVTQNRVDKFPEYVKNIIKELRI